MGEQDWPPINSMEKEERQKTCKDTRGSNGENRGQGQKRKKDLEETGKVKKGSLQGEGDYNEKNEEIETLNGIVHSK